MSEHWDSDIGYNDEAERHLREQDCDARVQQLGRDYNAAKHAAIGVTVRCANCGKLFVKKTLQMAFCSNARSKAGGNCKDRFWNQYSPDRADRASAVLALRQAGVPTTTPEVYGAMRDIRDQQESDPFLIR